MRNDEPIIEIIEEFFNGIPENLPLIVCFDGVPDAGNAVYQQIKFFNETSQINLIASFDTDMFYNYRKRRPGILFEGTSLTEYDLPELSLYHAVDDLGNNFLLLQGVEPDYMWERIIGAIYYVVKELKVSQIVWTHSIPMPVPHTRKIGVTVSGSRTDLIEKLSVWRPTTQIPATFGHVLEFRMLEMGVDVTGFVLLVPHYLAETEFPETLLTAFDCITTACGLVFATEDIRTRNKEFLRAVSEQIDANEETKKLVSSLEEKHDQFIKTSNMQSLFADKDGLLPDAEQIANEVEKFLENWNDSE